MFIEGAIAQLGERLPCTQEVSGSSPLSSTIPSRRLVGAGQPTCHQQVVYFLSSIEK